MRDSYQTIDSSNFFGRLPRTSPGMGMARSAPTLAALLFLAFLCLAPAPAEANGETACSSQCGTGLTGNSVVTRSYPICFFNQSLSDKEVERLKNSLREFVDPYMPNGIMELGLSFDARWLSVKGMQRGHSALKKVWPRVGCVGSYSSGSQYVAYRRCVQYLRSFLDQSSYEFMGRESDGDGISGQLYCGGR